ncbi:MAG: glutamate formimidoyltransferase [Thermodesulfobacteriota bacterium]|nr:glutamate formimidoyltransferase [Thermodesulfobacteriota bacterium]
MKKILECVPNFSEGRDLEKIDKIIHPFRGKKGVKLLDYQRDEDHNRLVVTAIGEPPPLKQSVMEAIGTAIDLIDMRKHKGQHPRMGAIDVVPFIPVRNINMTEAIDFSKEVAKEIASKYELPIFLYEESATAPERKNLALIRKGEFEKMAEKMKASAWKPDFGPEKIHPSAGVTAMGARMPLVAFNVNLNTGDMKIADAISKNVRHISGGLRYCKAIGISLTERGIVQVSMNMTDYTKTSLYRSFELVRTEAKRYGVQVIGSEIVGLVPMEALIDTAVYYMGIENFTTKQVLEARIWE